MFRVVFIKQVHSSTSAVSSHDYFLRREVELPCPPFQGLEYSEGEDGFSETIIGVHRYTGEPEPAEIVWRADENRFRVYVAEDIRFCKWDTYGATDADVAEAVAEYLSRGWELLPEDRARFEAALIRRRTVEAIRDREGEK